MGSKIKTVQSGGGSATGVANDFNGFLRQGLNNGSFGTIGQTNGIGNIIQGILSGRQGQDPNLSDINSVLSKYSSTPNLGMGSPLNLSQGMYTVPQTQTVGGYNPTSPAGVDLSSIMSQVGRPGILPSVNTGTISNYASSIPTRFQTNGATGDQFNAIQQALNNQVKRDSANLFEKYGVSSAGLNNQAVYDANVIPQLQTALTNASLAQRGANQADIGLGLQGTGLGLQGLSTAGSLGLEGRNQDLYNLLQSRGLDLSTLGLASNQALQGRGQDIGVGLQNVANAIGQNQFGTNAALASRGIDVNQLGLQSSNQLGNRGLDQSFLNQYGNLALGGGQLGLQSYNSNIANQLAGLSPLWQGFMQSNQLGTPQAYAQNIQQASPFSQFMSGITGLAGGIGSMMTGLGGVGGLSSLLGLGGGGSALGQIGQMPFGVLSGLGRNVQVPASYGPML